MHNSIGIIGCETFCLELPLTGSFVSLTKRNIFHNCGNFLQNKTTIAPLPKIQSAPTHHSVFVAC